MSATQQQEQLDEQLSALVDSELGRDEEAFVLRRIGHDQQARERLARYFMIRDALQRNLPAQPHTELAQLVREAVAREPAHQRRTTPFSWDRPALGGAIAASVVFLAVVWWQSNVPGSAPQVGEQPAAAAVQQVQPLAEQRPAGGGRGRQLAEQPQAEQGGWAMPVGGGVGYTDPWQRVEHGFSVEREPHQVHERREEPGRGGF